MRCSETLDSGFSFGSTSCAPWQLRAGGHAREPEVGHLAVVGVAVGLDELRVAAAALLDHVELPLGRLRVGDRVRAVAVGAARRLQHVGSRAACRAGCPTRPSSPCRGRCRRSRGCWRGRPRSRDPSSAACRACRGSRCRPGTLSFDLPFPARSLPWMLSWYIAETLPPGILPSLMSFSLPWQAPQVASRLPRLVFAPSSEVALMSCVPWQSLQVAADHLAVGARLAVDGRGVFLDRLLVAARALRGAGRLVRILLQALVGMAVDAAPRCRRRAASSRASRGRAGRACPRRSCRWAPPPNGSRCTSGWRRAPWPPPWPARPGSGAFASGALATATVVRPTRRASAMP